MNFISLKNETKDERMSIFIPINTRIAVKKFKSFVHEINNILRYIKGATNYVQVYVKGYVIGKK